MLVADLVRRGISDPKRIYLAGRSLAGVMALRMACVDSGIFAAIGLLISAMPDATSADCQLQFSHPCEFVDKNAVQDGISIFVIAITSCELRNIY
jgi:poly(3-hydroxybutyrate) depolymerase